MKKRILIFLLAFLLLGGSVFASAGSQADPLITRSYIRDSLLPRLRSAFAARTEAVVASAVSSPGLLTLTLSAGQSLELAEGEQLTLISGAARLSVRGGEIVDAAEGRAFSGGEAAKQGHRYIFCEGASGWADMTADTVLRVSYPARVGDGCPFNDVGRSEWFYADVAQAYRRGLVNGMDAVTYAPQGTLTAAQCVKLAACMHQLWQNGTVTLKNSSSGPWYRSYVDYALANGILTQEFADYDAIIVRRRFVQLFYRALPASLFTPINDIPDGAIPDTAVDDESGAEIYAFYRAGILTGYAADGIHAAHAFDASSTIPRAEVATIMNRMFEPEARKSFRID